MFSFWDSNLLTKFSSVSLEEIENCSLQRRVDVKYLLHAYQLEEFLSALVSQYSIVCAFGNVISPYKTLYYDTPNFKCYTEHHNGKANRYKFRTREYTATDNVFHEMKFKNNKGITTKIRIPGSAFPNEFGTEFSQFLSSLNLSETYDLHANILVYYNRITLAHKDLNERLTIDIDLKYNLNHHQKRIPNLVILEIKKEYGRGVTYSETVLKKIRGKKSNFSKYCMGVSFFYQKVKQNNFKNNFRTLQKMEY